MDAVKNGCLALILFLTLGHAVAAPEQANPKTAFQLVKDGDAMLAPKARDQILNIRSEPSEHGLVPTTWYILYRDVDTLFDSRELHFHNNRLEGVKKPKRLQQPFQGEEQVIPARWRKVDSDKVLEIVAGVNLVKDINLHSSQMWLQWEQGQAVWKVRLWGEHRSDGKPVELGEVYVSPETGEVMLVDLSSRRLGMSRWKTE